MDADKAKELYEFYRRYLPDGVISGNAETHRRGGTLMGWAEAQLARFTYKPGWTFTIGPGFGAGLQLRIVVECEDTYHPGEKVKIGKAIALPPFVHGDEAGFAHLLAREIQDMEAHESREWLKRDGVVFDNPHANEVPSPIPPPQWHPMDVDLRAAMKEDVAANMRFAAGGKIESAPRPKPDKER